MNERKGMRDGNPYRLLASSLAGAIFLSTLGVGVFTFAIPLSALQASVSALTLGAAFSGYFLAKLVITPVAGLVSDKSGPRPLLTASALVGMLAPLAALASRDHEVLYAVQFCLGLSAGVMKPVAMAAMAAVAPEQVRGRLFGLYNALYNTAFFLAPLLGGLLYYDRDLLPVLVFLVACMAASLVLIRIATPKILSASPQKFSRDNIPERAGRLQAGTLMLAVFGRTACAACLIAFYPILLAKHLHGPTWLVGLLFAVPSLAACFCLPLCGRLADGFDRKTLTVAGMAASSVCLALTGRMETVPGFLTIGVILGLGSGLSLPASMALASSMGDRQGAIMGWFHGAANAGFVIGPVACGLLVERYGEIPLPMGVMGSLGLAAVLPLALARLVDKRTLSWRSMASAALAVLIIASGYMTIHGGFGGKTSQASSVPDAPLNFAGLAMGNVVHMTLHGVEPGKGGEDSQAAFETISRLEKDFGHRNGSGSVGRVNMAAGRTPEAVSRPAFELIRRALDFCRASSGMFDITIGAVTVLPFYYREGAKQEKASLVDYRKVVLDEARQTVFLPEQGMALDLGGLAKGTILDEAARTLTERGVPSALVEAGGDLFCYGDREWKIGIQDPRGEGLLGVITVANAGVCGSGDYYQFALTED
ncbi:MAG: MFS transporter, partial [Desulfovibrio sp.]|nr:MFS transporter [Desulfovibrio sp.]